MEILVAYEIFSRYNPPPFLIPTWWGWGLWFSFSILPERTRGSPADQWTPSLGLAGPSRPVSSPHCVMAAQAVGCVFCSDDWIPLLHEPRSEAASLFSPRGCAQGSAVISFPGSCTLHGPCGPLVHEDWTVEGRMSWLHREITHEKVVPSCLLCGSHLGGSKHGRDTDLWVSVVLWCRWNHF